MSGKTFEPCFKNYPISYYLVDKRMNMYESYTKYDI